MMEKKRSVVVAVILLLGLCLSNLVFAETIILKSGVKIEAKIIERTDEYITIDFYGTPVTYRMYEIKSIGGETSALPSAEDKVSSEEEMTYRSAPFNFTINYPTSWEVQEINGITAFKSPLENVLDDFQENVNIRVQDMGNNLMSLQEYQAVTDKIPPKGVSNFKLLETESTKINGLEAYFSVYTGISNNYNLKSKTYIFIVGPKIYNITYTAKEEKFDKFLPQAEGIMKSIRITKSIDEEKSAFSSTKERNSSQDTTPSYHDRDTGNSSKSEFDKELLNFGIRFISPAGWQKVKLPDVPSAIYYTRPDKKASIGISLPLEANQASFKLSLAMLRMAKKPISEEKITFWSVPCYVFIIQHTNKAGMTIKIKNYQFFKNGKVYSIVYSSDVSEFYYYLPEFEKALDTFELVK